MSDIISSSGSGPNVDVPTPVPSDDSAASEYKGYTIKRKFGRYRILDCLGEGGMGMVFKARDTELDRLVALKVPFLGKHDEDTRQRFYQEARAAATLHHANICPVFDVGEIGGVPYMTMAFIDGRSLAEARAAGQSFTPNQAAALLRKLALAMQEAHSHGVIHRDLKPSNIMLRPNGEPMVMDFGLARRADDTASRGLTRKGDIIGTSDYMSPEQVEGDVAAMGPATDVYALGLILYELLAGQRPFTGTTASVLAATLVKPPPPPSASRPDVPKKLEEICLKALNKKPADRFPTMAQFAAALTDFLRSPQRATPATPASAPEPPAVGDLSGVAAPVDKPASSRRERPLPSGLKSGRKRSRSITRRKAKAKHRSYLPAILGIAALAVVAVSGLAVAAIGLWKHDTKNVAAPTVPAAMHVQAPAPRPTVPATPSAANLAPTSDSKPLPPKPRGHGFTVRCEPESVPLAVGKQEALFVKLTREDYQGPVNLRWEAPAGVRVSPASPVIVPAGQADASLNLLVLAEPAKTDFQLKITATPAQEPDRGSSTSQVALTIRPGPCVRVVEIADRSSAPIEVMAFAPDSSAVLIGRGAASTSGGDAHAIQVWNVDRGEAINKLVGHGDRVTGLAVSTNGKTALSTSADDTVAVWDLAQGRKKQQTARPQGLRLLTAAMSPDGKRGLFVYTGAVVKANLDNLQTAIPTQKLAFAPGANVSEVTRTAAVSAERKAVVGSLDGKLFLVDLSEKARSNTAKPLPGVSEAVLCAAFSPDGKAVAAGGGGIWQGSSLNSGIDNTVRLWDATTHKLQWTSDSLSGPAVSLAFSPDGHFVAAGSADGDVRVWTAEDGKPVATFKGHTGRVLGLAFAPGNPGNQTLWSGSDDRTLRQWRLP